MPGCRSRGAWGRCRVHEYGTVLSGFCQARGTTWIASHGTARRVLQVAPPASSLDRHVSVVGVEVKRAWDSGMSA